MITMKCLGGDDGDGGHDDDEHDVNDCELISKWRMMVMGMMMAMAMLMILMIRPIRVMSFL